MLKHLSKLLVCPICHSPLDWKIREQTEKRIMEGEAICSSCGASYPIRDGIGIFLTPDLPRNDLWENVDSALATHLRQHPGLEKQLMDTPLKTLSPTDQQFRALVLEERGSYAEAREVEEIAKKNLYTPEYIRCWDSQMEYTAKEGAYIEGPIVDLASGRCYLVEKLAGKLKRPIVASDFSPRVLRSSKKVLEFQGLYDQVSLLAFDARRTPFRDKAINLLTTNLGLPNIENPGDLVQELRRIVRGTFLAIAHFFPEDDQENRKAITEFGLDALLFEKPALERFSDAGWKVTIENSCSSTAKPTSPSALFEGARADGLPIADTTLDWGTLWAV